MEFWRSQTIYKKIVISSLAVHLIGCFIFPLASMTASAFALNAMAGFFGAGKMPKNLTLVNMLWEGGSSSNIAVLIVLAGTIALLAVHILNQQRVGYVVTSILSPIMFLMEVMQIDDAAYASGYEGNILGKLLPVLCVIIFITSIAELVLKKRTVSGFSKNFQNKKNTVSTSVPQMAVSASGIITGVKGKFKGAKIPVKSGESILIGRDIKRCQIILDENSISRKHCMIQYDPMTGNYIVVDDSANGTFAKNGKKLPSKRRLSLSPGTVIRIGKSDNFFQLG